MALRKQQMQLDLIDFLSCNTAAPAPQPATEPAPTGGGYAILASYDDPRHRWAQCMSAPHALHVYAWAWALACGEADGLTIHRGRVQHKESGLNAPHFWVQDTAGQPLDGPVVADLPPGFRRVGGVQITVDDIAKAAQKAVQPIFDATGLHLWHPVGVDLAYLGRSPDWTLWDGLQPPGVSGKMSERLAEALAEIDA